MKYAGIIITVLTLLVGAITGYAKLQGKVDVLKDKAEELKADNIAQDKRLSDTEKAIVRQEAHAEMILKILDRIEKKL